MFEGTCPACQTANCTLKNTGTSRFIRNPNTLVISLDLYSYQPTGKTSGHAKKNQVTYELQPEGIDISSVSFNHSNYKNKTVYSNFVGSVMHKGSYIH